MNQEYLKKLHEMLGITIPFDEWVSGLDDKAKEELFKDLKTTPRQVQDPTTNELSFKPLIEDPNAPFADLN